MFTTYLHCNIFDFVFYQIKIILQVVVYALFLLFKKNYDFIYCLGLN